MTAALIPLHQQINNKFEDPDYVLNTRKEMGSPDCLKRPMYVVGPKSKIPAVFRKVGSAALTIIGTITILPAIFWTVKSCVEFAVLPVSSRILRNIMRSARERAIAPPKGKLHDIIDTIKVIAKIALITAAVVASGYALGLGMAALIGIGVGTFVVTSLYELLKSAVISQASGAIKSFYTDHLETGPKHLRMSVMVDGERIDTYIVMHHDKIEPGQRWILATNGNEGAVADLVNKGIAAKEEETKEQDASVKAEPTMLTVLANGLKANVVTYNYGGCLGSEGQISAEKAARVYKAMKEMIENPNGLAAKEVVFYGHSIGGAFQAKGLEGLTAADFDNNVQYVCVKDRTFTNSDDQLRSMYPGKVGSFLRAAVRRFGWSLNVRQQCEELYANRIPQVNINHAQDELIEADGLVQNYSEQLGLEKDTTLLKSFLTTSVKQNSPNPHMDAPSEAESNQIIEQINTMLAFDRKAYIPPA